ncbi:cytochrome p450 26a1 [Plakobranchus ocellatus]|uniref:Cytochrome p450 26a1 n=1 Tax=Plakobranchus ocellatus TaxID=259542 RepID=A0AAV3XZ23_9GAST|nr:cytochrome p450 26a1 [Plakobranchus ocellatus]
MTFRKFSHFLTSSRPQAVPLKTFVTCGSNEARYKVGSPQSGHQGRERSSAGGMCTCPGHEVMDYIYYCVRASVQMPAHLLNWIDGETAWTEVNLTTSVLALLVLTLFAAFLTTILWRKYWENQRDPASNLPLPPGSLGWPLFGETFYYLFQSLKYRDEKRRQYGDTFKCHLFGCPIVRSSNSERIAHLISKEPQSIEFCLPKVARCIFGENSVFGVHGQHHAVMKRNLKQAFSPVRLADYLPSIQACARRHISSWVQGLHDRKLLGFDICQDLVCDLILDITLGCTREHDPEGKVKKAFVSCNDNLFSVPFAFPGTGFHKAKKARQVLVDFAKSRMAASSLSGQDHVTILDVLVSYQRTQQTHLSNSNNIGHQGGENCNNIGSKLDQYSYFSDENIVDNVVTFLVASADTLSSALCSVLDMLGNHPEVLADVRKELSSLDLLHCDHGSDLTYELLGDLSYIRAVNKEVLRMAPPAGATFRRSKQTIESKEYQIPRDWSILYDIKEIHTHTTVFTDKDSFLPERWLDQSLEKKLQEQYPCSYVPFGFGSRTCLGKDLGLMEMSVFVVEVTRLADWTLLNPGARRVTLPINKPFDNLPVIFRKRK